jgi:hypothetical protein
VKPAAVAVAAALVWALARRPNPEWVFGPPGRDILKDAHHLLDELLNLMGESPTAGELRYADLGITAGVIASREPDGTPR